MAINLVETRRAFHRIPEPGFKEHKTQSLILEHLKNVPQERLVIETWRTGVLVKIKGDNPQKTIGFRCDIDGLPIEEATGYHFVSEHKGYMHACGHDLHTTIGLGVVGRLAETPLQDDVVVIFQPAEEGPGGALPLLESDAFTTFRPDFIFALHVAPEQPTGRIAVKEGLLFANTSELFIDFKGQGGHAAFPHQANDMVVAASAFVTQIQSIVARRLDPLDSGVITIGKIDGGSKQNIIAERARVEGTMRSTSPEAMQTLKRHIEAHVKGIEAAYDCEGFIDYGANYYQVYNHADETRHFMDFCRDEELDMVVCSEAMTGEDFGYFLKEIPGFMFWLGVDSDSGLHTSTLKPDETAMDTGVKVVSNYIIKLAQ